MAWYSKFSRFAPGGEHLLGLANSFDSLCRAADTLLKAFVIGAWIYFAIEISHGLYRHFGGR